jgi:hypothetical protein
MVRIGLPIRSLALIAALACVSAHAATVDAETPDYLMPDAPGAAIETHRDADGRLQIEIQGERFDGRRLITRLLTDVREGPPSTPGADFDLHIAVATLAGFNGEQLRGVDLRLARRAGRIDDFALAGSTPGNAPVRGSAGGSPNARHALYLTTEDAGAFLRFVDLYDKVVNGRMWLTINLPAMREVGYSIRDFDVADDPALRPLRDALTPPAGQPHAQNEGWTPSRLRGRLVFSPGKIVVKGTSFFNKHVGATAEGIVEGGELNLRGVLAPAFLEVAQEPPCASSRCLRGLQYRVTGPLGAPKLVINPFIENVWKSIFPR